MWQRSDLATCKRLRMEALESKLLVSRDSPGSLFYLLLGVRVQPGISNSSRVSRHRWRGEHQGASGLGGRHVAQGLRSRVVQSGGGDVTLLMWIRGIRNLQIIDIGTILSIRPSTHMSSYMLEGLTISFRRTCVAVLACACVGMHMHKGSAIWRHIHAGSVKASMPIFHMKAGVCTDTRTHCLAYHTNQGSAKHSISSHCLA